VPGGLPHIRRTGQQQAGQVELRGIARPERRLVQQRRRVPLRQARRRHRKAHPAGGAGARSGASHMQCLVVRQRRCLLRQARPRHCKAQLAGYEAGTVTRLRNVASLSTFYVTPR
jgi:hypothetical protein